MVGSGVQLANLAIEEGRPTEAESPLREAQVVFRSSDMPDFEITAHAVLARALLTEATALGARERLADAQKEVETAQALLKKSTQRVVRLKLAIVGARVRTASGKTADVAEALSSLKATEAEARRFGFVEVELEARLALAEVQMKSARVAIGRALLDPLEKEARKRGFALIARKAAEARTANGGVLTASH